MQALYGNNPTYTPVSSPGLTAATNNATTSLNALTGAAPNYEAQAMQTLKDFQTQAAPQEQADIKSIENAAGETGRVGAEGVTTSLGDLATQYANNLQAEEPVQATFVRLLIEFVILFLGHSTIEHVGILLVRLHQFSCLLCAAMRSNVPLIAL